MLALYLGISGVLHPSESTYELVEGRSPWRDGHALYEAAPWLAAALRPWPDVRVVLTSSQPRLKGMPAVLRLLGDELAARVVGNTFEDLTTKARRGPMQRPLSTDDYWRLNTSELVRSHVQWLKPSAWVAVNDDSILWTAEERAQHLVEADGCKGLLDSATQDRLLTVLRGNFGPEP
ncbi:MAG: HAD domain-containing protein [Methylibium sp.]